MNSHNDENLKELFERFLDTEQADSNVEDIQKGEQIIREHPAPEPDSMLLANIKAEIAMRLPSKQTSIFSNTVYRIACAAASIMIISAICLRLLDKSPEPSNRQYSSIIPAKVWDGDDITTDDVELADYAIKIEQLEQELYALQSGDSASNSDSSLTELEMELVAINNDFWKE